MYTLKSFLTESGKAEAPKKIKTFEDFVNAKSVKEDDDEEETVGGEETIDAVQSEKDKEKGEVSGETQSGDDVATASTDDTSMATDVAKDVEKEVAADDAKTDVDDEKEKEVDAEEIADDDDDEGGED